MVTLDSHVAGTAARAEASLRRQIPGLSIVVHAADEWGSDPAALERCLSDIADADVVFTAMMFLEDHIRAVLPALTERRARCDAMLCCMSAGEVVRLTRLGKLDMSTEATGPLALLKKLRGRRTASEGSSGHGQMRMLRQLPRLLRFVPGTAQDLRCYFLAMQYWLASSEENLASLVRMLVDRYSDGPRRGLRGQCPAEAPLEYPDVGL